MTSLAGEAVSSLSLMERSNWSFHILSIDCDNFIFVSFLTEPRIPRDATGRQVYVEKCKEEGKCCHDQRGSLFVG